jgi:Ca-activated chloride channel family protein
MRSLTAIALSLCVLAVACTQKKSDDSIGSAPGSPTPAQAKPEPPPVALVVAYGSEKKTWLEDQVKRFQASSAKTKSGKLIQIKTLAMGSGEAVQSIVAGEIKPHVFSPASSAYIPLLNNAYAAKSGRAKALSPAGEPIVLSPVVVAMWKPMAEALGWPAKSIGWADLIKVNADPKGWGGKGHPEWGRFKLGHTHPEYSNSGLLSVLAEAFAGAKKTRGLTAADLDAKPTQAFIASVEQSIVHYGKSTGFFADKMIERGPGYLSAAVLYENVVIESYGKQTSAPFPIVSIYPVEGTFWSDHPYVVLDADWVKDDERDAAGVFLSFLKARPQQERALELGFRPADPAISIGAPIDAAHGADPKQPQTLLEVPDAATLEKLLAVWQLTKKSSDIVLVFDKSGSMRGRPLAEAKLGAKAFLDILHPRDEVTIIFFDGKVHPPIGPKKLEDAGKQELVSRIDSVIADGKTALYDATAEAHGIAQGKAQAAPGTIHAVVVMTDGNDEGSQLTYSELMKRFGAEDAPVKIFTIAYGDQVDSKILEQIADAAKGSSARGSPDTIAQVYRDMASFF